MEINYLWWGIFFGGGRCKEMCLGDIWIDVCVIIKQWKHLSHTRCRIYHLENSLGVFREKKKKIHFHMSTGKKVTAKNCQICFPLQCKFLFWFLRYFVNEIQHFLHPCTRFCLIRFQSSKNRFFEVFSTKIDFRLFCCSVKHNLQQSSVSI